MSRLGEAKKRRPYRPAVEALEALRLLSSLAQSLPTLPVELDVFSDPTPVPAAPSTTDAAWDAALTQTRLADILGPERTSTTPTDAALLDSGLTQLNRYLTRTWFRAGISPQAHDDCTQAVFVTLLQNLGRARFDHLLTDVGDQGIRDVLSRETADGPDFFRAIDMVKKRIQRERTFQPLDAFDVVSDAGTDHAMHLWRGALHDAIDQHLTPREAALVYDTLEGKTPAEIAAARGMAPKTVSNEKTRVIQKLRDALVSELVD